MPVVVAVFRPVEGAKERVRETLERHAAAVHEETGCLLWAIHESREEIVVLERWLDRAALQEHAGGAAMGSIQAGLEGLLEAPIDVRVLRPVPAGDPDRGQLGG